MTQNNSIPYVNVPTAVGTVTITTAQMISWQDTSNLDNHIPVGTRFVVDTGAATEIVTVIAHGRVGLTLLNLLHTADLDVVVTATASPRRSS